ncbi:MAG: hypothetical protein ABSA16_02095 [Thermoguttaceae bacterium]
MVGCVLFVHEFGRESLLLLFQESNPTFDKGNNTMLRKNLLMWSVVALFILVIHSKSLAQITTTWTGLEGSNWSSTNWTAGEPTSSVQAILDNGDTAIINQTGEACGTLTLGSTTIGVGKIEISGNALGDGQLFTHVDENIGNYGTGNFNQTAGTNHVGNYFNIGYYSGSNGTYNLTGPGQLTSVATEFVGRYGTGTFNQSAGTNTTLVTIWVGANSGSIGNYNLSNTGQVSSGWELIGESGFGTFKQSGGINTISNYLALGFAYNGNGTYNLTGGTLILNQIRIGYGAAKFNFGGGTLQANGTLSTTLPMTLTGDGGDANVDTAGNTVTLDGILSGTGGLNKLGANTLTLGANNSYIGSTTIMTGTLVLGSTATLTSDVISVANGAYFDVLAVSGGYSLGAAQTLKGSGTIVGNVTINGIHAPGDSPGVETVQGNYNMLGQLQIEIKGTTAGTGYDQVLLSGSSAYNATLGGTLTLNWADMNGSTDSTQLWILENDTAGTLSGVFSNYANGASLGNYDGHDWYIWYGADAATGNLTGGNDVLISAVPEPSMIVLLMTAALGIGVGSFQRKGHK